APHVRGARQPRHRGGTPHPVPAGQRGVRTHRLPAQRRRPACARRPTELPGPVRRLVPGPGHGIGAPMSLPVLVVVPTYDEADNIGPLLAALLASVPDAHVLVVDDNSPDGT